MDRTTGNNAVPLATTTAGTGATGMGMMGTTTAHEPSKLSGTATMMGGKVKGACQRARAAGWARADGTRSPTESVGHMVGNPRMEAEGAMKKQAGETERMLAKDKARTEGAAQQMRGNMQDAAGYDAAGATNQYMGAAKQAANRP
jgi:uncharacterized protein YjbJ (UPF0337 family)